MSSFGKYAPARLRFCAALVFLALIAGCAKTKWAGTHNNDQQTGYVAPDFNFLAMKEKVLAIGGTVMRDGIPLDEFCEIGVSRRNLTHEVQADLWSPQMDAAAIRLTPEVELSHWYYVQAHTPDALRGTTYATYAQRGTIKPHLVQEWASELPNADYLALACLENTWLDGTGQSDWARASGIGRVVVLTLNVYDLREGTSVWSHTVQKHIFGDSPSSSKKNSNESNDGPLAPPGTVNQKGTTTNAPTLAKALDSAMAEAMKELRKKPKSQSH